MMNKLIINTTMRIMKQIAALALFGLMLMPMAGRAQVYPIYLSVYGEGLFAGSINQIASGQSGNLSAQLIFNDVFSPDRQVYLKVSLQGNGINAVSRADVFNNPLLQHTISGGEVIMLDKDDFGKYLHRDNLVGADFTQLLPQGAYALSAEVFDLLTHKKISNTARFNFSIFHGTPPVLIQQEWTCGQTLSGNTIVFRWQSATSTSGINRIDYTLQLVEMLYGQSNVNMAFQLAEKSGNFAATVESVNSPMNIDRSELNLKSGSTYGFRVKASTFDSMGDEVFVLANNGNSDVCTFTYNNETLAPPCHAINNNTIYADAEANSLFLRWSSDREPNENEILRYKVGYRPVSNPPLSYYSETVTETTYRINGLTPDTDYDVFVQPLCVVADLPDSIKATFKTSEMAYVFKCGEEYVPSQRIMGQLKTQLAQNEVFYVGNLPVVATEALTADSDKKFTGPAKITLVFEPFKAIAPAIPGIGVTLKNIMIDNNNRVVAGYIQTEYDPAWGNVIDVGALFTGGSLQAELMATGFNADGEIPNGVINDIGDIKYQPGDPSITVYANENNQIVPVTFNIEGDPKPVNYIIKDASNHYYAVNTETGVVSDLGQYHGNIDELLAGVEMQQVDADIRVNFESNPDVCPYAFDPGNDQSPYFSCGHFGSKYENLRIGTSTKPKYYVPWKFVPTGSTGKVQFTLDPKNVESFSDANLKLYTSFGAELKFTVASGTYTVQLPPGEARTDYDLYAVYSKGDGKKVQAGKLRVRTESPKTYPVTLVTMATGINTSSIADDLNKIYEPFAISWDVTVDNSMEGRTDWDVEGEVPGQINTGDAFLSEYSDDQKMLHSVYKSSVSNFDTKSSVVFLFNNYPVSTGTEIKHGAKLGDMPIKRRWGYLFGGIADARTLAHELGHGRLTLRHTFADEHCGGSKLGSSDNLMDYPLDDDVVAGSFLNRFQWEVAHNPAIIGDIFQDDADGEFAPLVSILMKASIGAVADFGVQVVCNYYFKPECSGSWSCAMEGVNWLQVLRSAAEGGIPWNPPGGTLGKAAITATGDVVVNYADALIKNEAYGLTRFGIDFAGGFVGQLAGDGISELITKYGSNGIRAGLKKIGFSDSFISKFLGGEIADAFTKIKYGLRDISYTDEVIKSADEMNAFWKSAGYINPPYKADLPVSQIKVTQNTSFVRVYDGIESKIEGQFVMKLEDITNVDGSFLTAIEIKEKFALENLPKFVADVEIPAGTTLNCGIAGPLDWGEGGGLQFDLNYQLIGSFTLRATLIK